MTAEVRIAVLEAELRQTRADVSEMKADLKKLVQAANMGQGAWWATVKIGGLVVTIMMAGAYLLDHLPKWLGKS